METRHLFNTLRMIWNNHMPVDARVGAVRLYRFNPRTHSQRYLGEAIHQIGRELARRPDLSVGQRIQVEQMADYLRRRTTAVTSKPPALPAFTGGMHVLQSPGDQHP